MAMRDYGSVVKKNGIIIQNEWFMDMKESLGFSIEKIPYSYIENIYNDDYSKVIGTKVVDSELTINDNYFSYMGDEELLICVYKGYLTIISNGEFIQIEELEASSFIPFQFKKKYFTVNGINFRITRLYDNNRYKLRFWYKGDLYECLYGYGVNISLNYWYDVKPTERRYLKRWFGDNDV